MARLAAHRQLIQPPATGRYHYRWAAPNDDAALRKFLSKTPMEGDVSVTLERNPNFFLAAQVEGDLHRTVVAEDSSTGELAAIGSLSIRDAWINGRKQRLGYLSQLRVAPCHRHRLRLLKDGYAFAGSWVKAIGTASWFTTILADNLQARRLLEAGLHGLPRYEPVGTYRTCLISALRWQRPSVNSDCVEVVRATLSDLPAIRAMLAESGRRKQLVPMHAHMLENEETSRLQVESFFVAQRAGRLLGCIALWDQRPFKQVMIRSYSPHVRRWRWLHNTLIPITGQPCLPKPGSPLDHVYLSNVALPEAEIALFPKLLTVAARELWRRNPATIIAAGFDVNDPMLNLVGQQFVYRRHDSIVYRIHWDDVKVTEAWNPGILCLELATL